MEGEEFDRVDGRWRCPECGLLAMHHPYFDSFTTDGELVRFRRLCDGRLAKL